MTFPMARTHSPKLTFIVQAEIQVQEASSKEKKEKGTLMAFPVAKTHSSQAYLHSPRQNPSPGSVP